MDDTKPEIGLAPEFKSDESLSESNRAELIVPVAGSVESTPTRAIPTNGSSPLRIAANRSNAKKSTGPKTSRGKAISSWNSATSRFTIQATPVDLWAEQETILPFVGQPATGLGTSRHTGRSAGGEDRPGILAAGTAAWHEAEALTKENPFTKSSIDRILRYQTTINRQLFQAMNQLERLQRLRQGDHVPAPVNIQVSQDTATISEEQDADR